MSIRSVLTVTITFAVAAAVSVAAANVAATQIETRSVDAVAERLRAEGFGWVDVTADGLQLGLTGTAPDEAARFRALSLAGMVVDGARVVDLMDVAQRDAIAAPDFSIEVLRANDGVTLIGLVPEDMDRMDLLEDIARIAPDTPITDLLQTARFPSPETWDAAVALGVEALRRSDKAKVSIEAERVAVKTMVQDDNSRAKLTRDLNRLAPAGVEIALDITAPRPVISPFLLRLTRQEGTTRFDACAAATDQGRQRILAAAGSLGAEDVRCDLGLGAPSPAWADAAARALEAMRGVGTGTLTVSDLDVRLEAAAEVDGFGRIAADLRRDLPEEFTLTAVQADVQAAEPEAGPAEFVATRSPEGLVQLQGRVGTQLSRTAVTSLARALFGADQVDADIEIAEPVPLGWSPTILAALDALSQLHHGAVSVDDGGIRVSGTSGSADAPSAVARLLSGRLGDDADFSIDIAYDKRLDATLALPSPDECASRINEILSARQIAFDPGSAVIAPASRDSVDAIAEVLGKCEGVAMEVGGHTDSQGREEMNKSLSQERAEAVLAALLSRRVPVGDLTAVGYGEETPIADNGTEEGREANRRIEFRLLTADQPPGAADETPTDPESGSAASDAAAEAETGAATDAQDAAPHTPEAEATE